MHYKPAVVVFFLFAQSDIIAKTDTIPHLLTGLQFHYGFIIPHSESIRNVSYTNPYGIELSRRNFRTSFKDWQVFNAYWISGVEVSYFNFQNPEILGYAFAVSAFAEPVISHRKRFFFTIKGGGGLSYHSLIYDPVDNPLNMFFSSKISFPIYVSIRFKYRIGDKTFLTLSGSYNHISNGGYKQPNKGMNFPTLAIGLEHSKKMPPVLDDKYSLYPKIQRPGISLQIQALTTLRIIGQEGGHPQKTCFVYGLSTRLSVQFGPIYSINAGAELIGDGYIKETLKRDQTDLDYKRFALTLGQDFSFGRVTFTQYFGFYIYSPFKAINPIYQKYELAYNVFNNFSLGVYLKAHAQVAESMGFIINYKIFFFGDEKKNKQL